MNIIINQILIMGLIMLVGYILRKQGYFNEEVTEGLSKFSLRIIVPLTIIEAFIQPFSMQLLKEMFTIGLITVIFTFITIFVCNILYKYNRGVEKFATVFTNRGFIGIPIVRALFGSEAISLLTPIIFIGHVFMWTYGINLMSEDKKHSYPLRLITKDWIESVAYVFGVGAINVSKDLEALLRNYTRWIDDEGAINEIYEFMFKK